MKDWVIGFQQLSLADAGAVGTKNASQGELMKQLSGQGIKVPPGFALSFAAFQHFLSHGGLHDRIAAALSGLREDNPRGIEKKAAQLQQWVMAESFSPQLEQAVTEAYEALRGDSQDLRVAVRSSTTKESFPPKLCAAPQAAVLNVRSVDELLNAIKQVFCSLYHPQAITYRANRGYSQVDTTLSVGIQTMIDTSVSGVMFSTDPDSGFENVIQVSAGYGLGAVVLQDELSPDEYYLYKPSLRKGCHAVLKRSLGRQSTMLVAASETQGGGLTAPLQSVPVEASAAHQFTLADSELEALGRQALIIEQHFGCPVGIKWGKSRVDQQLYIFQAHPEFRPGTKFNAMEDYLLKESGKILASGRAVGRRITSGVVRRVGSIAELQQGPLTPGEILVTDHVAPDWEPLINRGSAFVTERGGRTCHAAIMARELGIPAVVSCEQALDTFQTGDTITVCCAEGGEGHIYHGELAYDIRRNPLTTMPSLPLKMMINTANPDRAFSYIRVPHEGIGLVRMEFIINRMIGIHPKALVDFADLSSDLKSTITRRIRGYASPEEFFVEKVAEGIACLAAMAGDKPVVVRLSDFKSNEYAHLIGGSLYEPNEENPVMGFRGAARYCSIDYKHCFALECRAIRKVRETMGFSNIQLLVPFVRTAGEARQITQLLAAHRLERGRLGLKVLMMCELPVNVLQAERFLEYFDGYSIGTSDLCQFVLGVDRDSSAVSHLFDESHSAVKQLMALAISACKKMGKEVGVCGQGTVDKPLLAQWLCEQEVDFLSVNADCVLDVWQQLASLPEQPVLQEAE